jgi:hypothetical protein
LKKILLFVVTSLLFSVIGVSFESTVTADSIPPSFASRSNCAFVFSHVPPKKYTFKNYTYTLITYQKVGNSYIGTYY